MRPVRVGCSGWQYDDWRGVLYPEGLAKGRWLERYSQMHVSRLLRRALERLETAAAAA